jgi:SAM-dependent methyltransferase
VKVLGFIQVDEIEGVPSVPDQLGAINDYCARQGWELLEVYERPPQSALDEGLARALAGDADAVVAAVQGALWPDAASSQPILQSSVGAFGLVITSVGLDSTTDTGKLLLDRLLARMATELHPSPSPLPPPDLIRRVTGSPEVPAFESGGDLDLRDFEAALARQGRALNADMHVLDFGCGCGRLLRHLMARGAGAQLSGSDIDAPAVEWVDANLEGVTARVNDWLPPLPFDDASFDLVIGFSVFTHLDENYQDQWLSELQRVIKPGGLAMLTMHGDVAWQLHRETALAGRPELESLEQERAANGFAFWNGDGWAEFFPDYYHTAFHTQAYIRSHWGEWFDVLEIVEAGGGLSHDLVVLERRSVG